MLAWAGVSGPRGSNRKESLRSWWAEDRFGISSVGFGVHEGQVEAFQGERGEVKEAARRQPPAEEGAPWLPCNLSPTDLTFNLPHAFMLHTATEFFFSEHGLLKALSSPRSSGSPTHTFNPDIQIIHPWVWLATPAHSRFPYQNPQAQAFPSCCLPLHISSFHFCTLELTSYSIKKQITIRDTESD